MNPWRAASQPRSRTLFLGLIAFLLVQIGEIAAAKKVDVQQYPSSADLSMEQGWDWAVGELEDQPGGGWIGWRVTSLQRDVDVVAAGAGGAAASNSSDPTLAALLGAGSDEESAAPRPPDLSDATALLVAWAPGYGVRAVRLVSFLRPAELKGYSLRWLGKVSAQASAAQLAQLYPSAGTDESHRQLFVALAAHDVASVPAFFEERLKVEEAQEVRAAAVHALASVSSGWAVDLLNQVAETDQNPALREKVFDALGSNPSLRAERALIELIESSVEEALRRLAIRALVERASDGAVAAVRRLLWKGSDVPVLTFMNSADTQMPAALASAALQQAARSHSDPAIRAAARESITTDTYEESAALLRSIVVGGENDRVREAAMVAIATLPTDVGMPILISLARDEHSAWLRRATARLLRYRGGDVARETLESMVWRDDEQQVRAAALDSLCQLADGEGLSSVAEVALTHPDVEVRDEAMSMLSAKAADDEQAARLLSLLMIALS